MKRWRDRIARYALGGVVIAAFVLIIPAEPVSTDQANTGPPSKSQTKPIVLALAEPEAAPPPITSNSSNGASPAPVPIAANNTAFYMVRFDHWTDADERGYGEFVAGIGKSGCNTVNTCLRGRGNPFRASDPKGVYFRADCADLPYVLRAYYAWKRGLPFSYESAVSPRGYTRDIRYTAKGNKVAERRDIVSGQTTGLGLLETLRDTISSASYRIHPDLDGPLRPDFYSPAINAKSIRPGTIIYDPNGHLAVIYQIDPDGRIHYIDSHPDNSLTRGFYDERFVRARPGMGAGFKNWRPQTLKGATRRADGVYVGGHVTLPANKDIADYSETQFFGTGKRPQSDSGWGSGPFVLNGEMLNYYDYVRAKLAGGKLEFDPVREVRDMVESNCNDLHYREDAVNLAIAAGLQNQQQPRRLPPNIYGTEGDWELYSTPSRDARLKTAFRELRERTARFVRMWHTHDKKLKYTGHDLIADLIATYDAQAAKCTISYTKTDGSTVRFGYEDARKRLFAMSFDPYHCIEHRWGASSPAELATCRDNATKRAWYRGEQKLRNQLDRTYDARMDFTLAELGETGPGHGVANPPDTDVRGYLIGARAAGGALSAPD
jgi:hypothetical protein